MVYLDKVAINRLMKIPKTGDIYYDPKSNLAVDIRSFENCIVDYAYNITYSAYFKNTVTIQPRIMSNVLV